MMTILLERREYLRATHLQRQTCTVAMAVGSKLSARQSTRQFSRQSRRQFTFVDSFIVKGPIRLRDSRGQNLAAGTRFCERLYQAQF